eukprot:scaffold189564_cov31-Tisochrysis_lutea.AAC.1
MAIKSAPQTSSAVAHPTPIESTTHAAAASPIGSGTGSGVRSPHVKNTAYAAPSTVKVGSRRSAAPMAVVPCATWRKPHPAPMPSMKPSTMLLDRMALRHWEIESGPLAASARVFPSF